MMNSRKRNEEEKKIILKVSDSELADLTTLATLAGYQNVSDYLLFLYRNNPSSPLNKSVNKNEQPNVLKDDLVPKLMHSTAQGKIYVGDSSALMNSILTPKSIDLIMTSPPFGLIKKKVYGNEDADEYLAWFEQFAEGFLNVLKPDGSLVIDIGGAWKQGQPTRSLYHFELLIMLCRKFGFHLAQEFYWWNPSKLPTPAEWVTVRRIRVKDAVNCIWWLSLSPYPKAINRRVLQPYSKSMKKLLDKGYKPKKRPSGHDISDKFQKNNKGAIPPNLIALANTESNSRYQRYCRENNLTEHPARFPEGIPAYFVRMLTNEGDTVLDPFAGSCVTGEVAEKMKRKWICCDLEQEYVEGALGRFETESINENSVGPNRRKPYEIYPPVLDLVDEEDAPFPEDGGRTRPRKRAN